MNVIILVLRVNAVKVLRIKKVDKTLSVLRTQYILFNIFIKQMMKNQYVLDALSAAHTLAARVLKKADHVFYRQRRTMEDSYGMTHGTFSGV